MLSTPEDQDVKVRTSVYEATISAGLPPTVNELAERLGVSRADMRESLERLAAARALVLQRESREVLMANPFSAVPTPFAVHAQGRIYYGNCIWDALGIPAMLQADARIASSCGCCSEAMSLSIRDGQLGPATGIVHFAIPARRWWQDIVYN
ncbi:MAG: GntR family transcriptional regulator [Acidobacteria bacterium]|nr:GntR family transcriptional regulator [Acidobacteriota bacterium]